MGCCNKTHTGKPIGRLRYYGGLAVVSAAQLGALAAISGLAVPFPRYRKVLPFYRAYAADTVREILDKERIRIRGMRQHEETCEWHPAFGAPRHEREPVAPAFDEVRSFAQDAWEPAL